MGEQMTAASRVARTMREGGYIAAVLPDALVQERDRRFQGTTGCYPLLAAVLRPAAHRFEQLQSRERRRLRRELASKELPVAVYRAEVAQLDAQSAHFWAAISTWS